MGEDTVWAGIILGYDLMPEFHCHFYLVLA